ncbi:MAG: sulfate ABC transporter ATP-binding protein [Burkholderiales bacterium]|jgi:sulfate transport system ATP-binding protein|nr:sulfate ABC transporter ATP-binding protein [Burkholderiales bacterium]
MSITIENVHKKFGSFDALKNINLTLEKGALTALLGPSGSGKTTLLRIIAGLEEPDGGSVHFFGENITRQPINQRKVGFVFQHYALFKHMTIFDNVAFGLNIRPRATRPTKEIIKEKVFKLLSMVQLESMAKRYPSELSGGQKQRVALARALAVEPRVLLLDEPFGALDAKVRQELRRWLRYLHDETHLTSVFVTHDQEEALEVADQIVILNQGAVEQVGSPEEVYDHPINPFVYGFMGHVNLYHGRRHLEETRASDVTSASNHAGQTQLFVRPHDIELSRDNPSGKGVAAQVISYKALGNRVRVGLNAYQSNETIEANIEKKSWRALNLELNDNVYFTILDAKYYNDENTWSDYVI